MNSSLKVRWIGEGTPPSGVYEYGAGTQYPTIPRGILARRETTTNWSFEYVYPGAQNANAEYLSTPVWVYSKTNDLSGLTREEKNDIVPDTDDEGNELGKKEGVDETKLYFTLNPETLPSNVGDIEKVTIGDIYLYYYGAEPQETGSINKTPLTQKTAHKGRQREGAAIRNKKAIIQWDANGNITLTEDENGSSIVGIYAMALALNSSTLANAILEFAQGADNKLTFNSFDMFNDEDFAKFYSNKKLGWMCMSAISSESLDDIKDTIKEYYTYYANEVGDSTLPDEIKSIPEDKFHSTGPHKQGAPNGIDTSDELAVPLDFIEHTKKQEEVKKEKLAKLMEAPRDIPKGHRLSKEVTTEGAESGRMYLLGASDDLIESIIMTMRAPEAEIIHAMFDEKDNLRYGNLRAPDPEVVKEILRKYPDHYGDIKRPTAQNVADAVASSIISFAGVLSANGPELTLSPVKGDIPGFVSKNFPFLNEMGTDAEAMMGLVASGIRESFLRALKWTGNPSPTEKKLKARIETEGADNISINLADDSLRNTKAHLFYHLEDTEDFQYAAKTIAERTGKEYDEVVASLTQTLSVNYRTALALKTLDTTSVTLELSGKESKILQSTPFVHGAGIVVGLLSAMNDNTVEMGASIASEGFSEFVTSIFGENISFNADDWFTYTDSEDTDFRISMGMVHYMSPGLPYFMRNKELYVVHNGEELMFKNLSTDRQTEIRDEFASSIMGDALNGMSSDEFLSNYLRKYQEGLLSSSSGAEFGDRKAIKVMEPSDDDVHFSPTEMKNIDARVYGTSLLAQKYMNGLLGIMKDKKIKLTEDSVREILLEKENSLDGMKDEVLEQFNVPEQHRDVIWEAMKDAVKQSREGMVRDILTRNVKTNLARNLEGLAMIPLLCNIASKSENFSIERGMTGYFSNDLDMKGVVDEKPDGMTFLGFTVNADGVTHHIAKEKRTAGFGDILHLRKKEGALLVTTFEIKAAEDSSQKSHVSAITPWMNSLLRLGRDCNEIRISKLRDMNIIYGANSNESEHSGKVKKDGSSRKVRGSDQGSLMKRHSRYSKRRIGIPTSSFQRTAAWNTKGEPTQFSNTPTINLGQILELQSADGRGFASF